MSSESLWFEPESGRVPEIGELDIVRIDLNDGSAPRQFLVTQATPDPEDPAARRLRLLADPEGESAV